MLRGAESAYDLVVATKFELVTVEGLGVVRDHLGTGGVFALRYDLDAWDAASLRATLATIRTVFEHAWAWRFRGTVIVLAFKSPPTVSTARWRTTLVDAGPGRRVAHDAGIDGPGGLLRHFILDTEGIDAIAAERSRAYVDDRPTAERERARLRLMPRGYDAALDVLLREGFPPDFSKVVPGDATREAWLAEGAAGWLDEAPGIARAWYRNVDFGRSAEGLLVRARIASALGMHDAAARHAEAALRRAPENGEIVAERIRSLPLVAARGSDADVIAEVDRLRLARPDDGRVQSAAALAFQRLGVLDRAQEAFDAALRADRPPAPPGTGINAARLRLAGDAPDPAAVRAAMENDPTLYEDPDALSLYIGMLEPKDHLERAAELEDVLRTIERERAADVGRRARQALARGTPEEAHRLAEHWTEIAPAEPRAWLLRGLTGSILGLGDPADARRRAEPYREAIRVSREPEKTRRTAAPAPRLVRNPGRRPGCGRLRAGSCRRLSPHERSRHPIRRSRGGAAAASARRDGALDRAPGPSERVLRATWPPARSSRSTPSRTRCTPTGSRRASSR